MKNILLFTIITLLSPPTWTMKLSDCEGALLGQVKLADHIKKEASKDPISSEYLSMLKKIKTCADLLDMATLKSNGMVKERNPISAKILERFVDLHHEWLMPKSSEQSPSCIDKYQWEVYDRLAPSYHLTRALFQEDRKVQQALTAYGDLRSVRAGDNPTKSLQTGLTDEAYQKFLATNDKFQFSSKEPIVGFLFKRRLSTTNFTTPNSSSPLTAQENWPKENLNVYKHFGGGLLGSPSFLYFYGQGKAFYRSNGRQILPRKYASAIWNNLLCEEPNLSIKQLTHQESSNEDWNHPITQEKNCISCHKPLDTMAAAFRHITFIPTRGDCSDSSAQIHIPFSFKATGTREIWSKKDEDKNLPFHLSYPVGFHNEQRIVGLAQLGKSIAKDPRFYRCQVIKYYQFIHQKKPSDDFVETAAKEYQEHQNGMTLLKSIMARSLE